MNIARYWRKGCIQSTFVSIVVFHYTYICMYTYTHTYTTYITHITAYEREHKIYIYIYMYYVCVLENRLFVVMLTSIEIGRGVVVRFKLLFLLALRRGCHLSILLCTARLAFTSDRSDATRRSRQGNGMILKRGRMSIDFNPV